MNFKMNLKKELYELVRKDECVFDFIQEYALDGLWYWDLEKRENIWVNKKMWEVLGFGGEVDSKNTSSTIDLLKRNVLEPFARSYTAGKSEQGKPVKQIINYTKKDGTALSMVSFVLPICNKTGESVRLLGAQRKIIPEPEDQVRISEAKEKAEKIEARYRTLFENMNTGFVLFEVVQNEQGKPVDLLILAANKSFEKTTGLNLRDAIGKRLTDVLPGIEKDEADWIGTYSNVAISGKSHQFEQGSELLGYFYSISAFQAEPNQCAVTFLDITERKLGEKKFRESELRFRKLFEDSPNGMVMVKKDLKFFKANPAFCKMTGFSGKELQDLTFADITHEDDKEKDLVHVKRMLAGELNVYRTEKRYLRKNGDPFWVHVTISPIFDAANNFNYFFGVVANITERKNTEKHLVLSEERLRLATKHARVAVWEYDFKSNSMARTPTHDDLYGLEWQSHWDISTFLNATHPDDREYSNSKIMNSVAPGGPDSYGFNFRVIHPDNTIHWLAVKGEVIERDDTGRGLTVRGSLIDITDLKRHEMELVQLSNNLKSAQEIAHLGSFEFILETQTTIWSEEEYRIFGFDPKEPSPDIPLLLEKSLHPEDAEWVGKSFLKALQKREIYEFEYRIVRPDGNVRWVVDKAQPNFDENGNFKGYKGATLDITERKLLQERLERLNTQLEQKVNERTAMLEASNKELEAFSYSVSHDLRAPLRHINGYVDLLNQKYKTHLPEKALHYLDTISDASKQMGTLIDELLQYSRTGQMELKKTEVDQNALLEEVMRELLVQVQGRNIQWKVEQLPRVFGDPALLKLVWTNLIGNAIKYTGKEAEAEILIGCEEQDKSFVFSVKDNGVGFDMKYSQKLFGIFQRLHTQSQFEGTGIGLANVKRIVKKHSGKVWAEAEPGKGATFYFTLPKPVTEKT